MPTPTTKYTGFRCVLPVIAFLLFGGPPSAQAWWSNGHDYITREAVHHLPGLLKVFFEQHASSLGPLAANEPFGKHYIDIDNYPEWPTTDFPRDRDVLIAAHGSSFVDRNGEAPWTIGTYVQDLANQMGAAQTESDWISLLLTAAELAHYVEDVHNPLHLTANYNGQQTGNYGIHARYEGYMVGPHLGVDLTISPNPSGCRDFSQNPFGMVDPVLDEIETNYSHISAILAADDLYRGSPINYDSTYYANMWGATGGFTQDLFQEASEQVASAWYTAWVMAGRPVPVPLAPPPPHIADVRSSSGELLLTVSNLVSDSHYTLIGAMSGSNSVAVADFWATEPVHEWRVPAPPGESLQLIHVQSP